METATGEDTEGILPPALERTLPDDAAEYMLFVLGEQKEEETSTAVLAAGPPPASFSRPRARLDQVRKAALKLADDLTRDYIWQRDAFNLEIVSRDGLLYLRGITSYGDCVEDEWLIVYMLREISKLFPDVWVRIADSDGEFLLVEAAKAVPKWLNPDIDAHRVWIHRGELVVIPPEATDTTPSSPLLSLADAVRAIKTAPDGGFTPRTPPALEKEAFYRLNKYPGHVAASIYHTRLILPRKIAYLLHDRPRAVAPAVEAFVARDPITTKRVFGPPPETNNRAAPSSSSSSSSSSHRLQFPPTDLVVISVKLTRVLYAQLRGQRFTPPAGWPAAFGAFCEQRFLLLDTEAKERGKGKATAPAADQTPDPERLQAMVEVSMKLTCGFELLVSTADTSNNRIVREIGLILEDLAEDDDGAESELPTDADIQAWKDADREDDDAWLNIDLGDFERELDRGSKAAAQEQKQKQTADAGSSAAAGRSAPKPPAPVDDGAGFGDARVQTDLRRIVSQFQAFLNDNDAGIEGAEVDEMDRDDDDDDYDDDDDESDDDVDFDEEQFNRLMREMMGLPPDESSQAAAGPDANTTTANGSNTVQKSTSAIQEEDDDEEGILKLAAQFEAELKGHGALKLNPPKPKSKGASSTKAIADEDNRGSAVASKTAVTEDDQDSDDDSDVDVDFNLAKNLLESFKGQEGMAGPAGNILSMLGMTLPRDDEDTDEEEE